MTSPTFSSTRPVGAVRRGLAGERGFTLTEILVVILIVGILAAIAIPVFLGQRRKAQDASAKSAVRIAAVAAGVYATGNEDSYSGMAIGDLSAIETSLGDAGSLQTGVTVLAGSPSATGYTVYAQSKSGTYFVATRSSGTGYRCTSTSAPSSCTSSSTPTW